MVSLTAFRKWAKQHPNFITPHILSLRDRGIYIIELSEGTDFDHRSIYGVTLLKMEGSSFNSLSAEGVNKLCYSKKEAQTHILNVVEPYIKSLKK